MKRRALLLLGPLLMPTTAHARTTRKKPAKQPATKAAAKPKPFGAQPLKEGKTQLVAFNASAFPYRSVDPGTRKPFLDAKNGSKRGHTSLRGEVYWEDPTYSDRRSLLYLPPAFLMGFPMPTAMTTLGRLGKDHMFLWAWGINGCFSVIGAALVPIVATSFGLPAVVLVGAFAYLVALPAFFSVLMPLRSGRPAAA